MTGENDKTFTEDEHLAVLADRISKETATLQDELDVIKSEKDDLANQLDVETAARTKAEQERDEAQQELETFKTDLQTLKEEGERRDERLDQVKEVAEHLGDDFLQDEKRVARIVAMDDDAFEGYLTDLRAAAPTEGQSRGVPRETAMSGAPASPRGEGSAARAVFLSRFNPAKEG